MKEEEKKVIEFLKENMLDYEEIDTSILLDINSKHKTILNLIEKLQKENKELKADNYELNNRINDLLENIPIQKVKDKIEELNSRIEIYRKYVKQGIETDVEWVDNVADRETVKVLQELIEEREEK